MWSYGLPDQNRDVRDDVHHTAHVCSQSGLLHELANEALPRTLAEAQTPTRQPPRARHSGRRRGPHQKDFVGSPCQAVRGNALTLLQPGHCRNAGGERRQSRLHRRRQQARGGAVSRSCRIRDAQRLPPEDVESIVAYARTLKPVEYTPPPRDMAMPLPLAGVRPIPAAPAFRNIPAKTDRVAYGEYMANA